MLWRAGAIPDYCPTPVEQFLMAEIENGSLQRAVGRDEIVAAFGTMSDQLSRTNSRLNVTITAINAMARRR